MARYFYDTEFHDDGCTIDLISIGIAADDGREYYAVNYNADWDRISEHPWLMGNVVPQLVTAETDMRTHQQIATEVRDFLLAGDTAPELWGYYSAYDHVVLAQLWGPMINMPDGIPMHTHDLKQELARLGDPPMPEQCTGQHDALADARHIRTMWHHVHNTAIGDRADVNARERLRAMRQVDTLGALLSSSEPGDTGTWVNLADETTERGRGQVDHIARVITHNTTSGAVDFDDPAEAEEYRNHQRDLARAVLAALTT